MRLLGLDPGGQTGYALVEVLRGNECRLLDIGQFPERTELQRLIGHSPKLGRVIFESFCVGPRTPIGVNLVSMEVIGAIKALCEMYGVQHLSQMPDQRQFIDKRYPDWCAPYKHLGGVTHAHTHGGDALMHVLTYAVRHLGVRVFHHLVR
jgi:hypothetical protein